MICQFLPDLRGGSGEADVGPRGVQVKGIAEFRERRARAGGLQALGGAAVETGRGYYLGTNATRCLSEGVRALIQVLEAD